VARVLLGYRQVKPWISYDAQRVLEKHLNKQSSVLEFGSGMSTVWYAQRAGTVVSVESYHPWHEKVSEVIRSKGVQNVILKYADGELEYADAHSENGDSGFDLIMIDGSYRDECARQAIRIVKPGGVIYLDNSDTKAGNLTKNIPLARKILLDFAAERGARVTFYTDFAPTQFAAHEGMMIST
jgi:predicted O-methyltransferase YrrM